MENIDINRILPLVQKPARYINHEWNSYISQGREKKVSVCLCFPDMYETGASNLGIELLYHMVNGMEEAYAERCFAPAQDLEIILRKQNARLFSLETQRPLCEFEIVGISLQHELCATNVLNILDLGGMPVFSKDRDDKYPLVIGGGPITANPEPFADFFDLFVIGDGETALVEIIKIVKGLKGKPRQELLLKLSGIKGVYVPSLYSVKYFDDGKIKEFVPKNGNVPLSIFKNAVDINAAFFPEKKIVPFMDTVHNRINVEIARGCPQGCRFCLASRYHSPWRARDEEKVLSLSEKLFLSSGCDEISFSSLSCSHYAGIEGLLAGFHEKFDISAVKLSLPSLRCEPRSVLLAESLGKGKKSGLTFAPEAGTERLRDHIGKNLSDATITQALLLAWKNGWKNIKLYFMIGLPSETKADITAIETLVRSVKKLASGMNFGITVSVFVPKPQTPFQWVNMEDKESLLQKIQFLKKRLPATVKGSIFEQSIVEAVLARGDRRLSGVIYRAWKKGARFDQWMEMLNSGFWEESLKEEALSAEFYLREREESELLPWEHIVFTESKEKLLASFKKAGDIIVRCDEANIKENIPAPKKQRPETFFPTKTVQRYRLRFGRKGVLRFLSHLEQIELFRGVFRRAGMPIVYTEGFSPKPKVSFGPAISVGYESESEYAEVSLGKKIEREDMGKALRDALPGGYELLEAKQIPVFFPAVDSLLNTALYKINIKMTEEDIRKFLSLPEIMVEKNKKGKITAIDAKPLIYKFISDGECVRLWLRFGPLRNVKAEQVIKLACGLDEEGAKLLNIKREMLFMEKKDGALSVL